MEIMSSPPDGEGDHHQPSSIPSRYSIESSDPHHELVDREGLDESDIAQIDVLMGALSRLRAAEQALSEASLRYMRLGETDMRALHFLIVCENTDSLATPGMLAQALEISSASTTKLLDRLERAGHVRRAPPPFDRRALVVSIEPATRASAIRTVGAQQARRVHAARRLTPAQREVVISFLDDMVEEISVDNAEWARPENGDDQR